MPRFFAPLAILSAAIAAPVSAQSLPGVSDEEGVIRNVRIQQIQRGNGDVVFVRDGNLRWYRVALNEGCLDNAPLVDRAFFRPGGLGNRIDRFSMFVLAEGSSRSCRIDSIRRSEAPPQVDSDSIVTLD